ncbi:FkbM family methyltransferase [Saccharomonospora azurea]|uniref:Methyltransferase, FkbM family n=1 Tax=Saccharomonospora azurea NA-128 TaxID=882081 RepID=H8GC83_9PSEU|nr:FkbM family methyltransferase [Saccharomonospora azurea]EHK80187.1 FkbM family methyltransferase [Saccharomonospora azurea SZMC 14600]EHK81424.1 FkbM family methyltransferase [Saccharomonospora azurea SZMC 14600]EHY87760.1 methyltransferase, FkbM family [Saccharomonospora azurea NA-128]
MTEVQTVRLPDGKDYYIPAHDYEQYSEIEFIYSEVWNSRDYLSHGIELRPGAVVVDAGAHVGLFTLFVKHLVPDARVLAFEPVPVTRHALLKNLQAHGGDGVSVHPVGLGERREENVVFTCYPRIPANSTRYPAEKRLSQQLAEPLFGRQGWEEAERQLQGYEVSATVERLSDVLARRPDIDTIDLLKVDVEGAELDVLAGIDDSDWPRIRQAVVEVQDLDGRRLDAVVSVLARHGFTTQTVGSAEIPAELRYFLVYATRV